MSEYGGPIVLMALAGILIGGAISLYKNDKRIASIGCALVGAAAFVGGAYLVYG